MGDAKLIRVAPITSKDAHKLVRRVHYSGKSVNNSQLHLGVFRNGRLEGAMQFGPSMDKRKIQGLVTDTGWNGFIELNRMAFSERLPRNSESRALGVAMRLIRQKYPHIEWVVSFADATQCGDGTIYRAAGFVLTGIKKNTQIWEMPDGNVTTRMVATNTTRPERRVLMSRMTVTKGVAITETGGASMRLFAEAGAKPLPGFQLRYFYFLNPAAKSRLTVPVIPFSAITERGAGMYKGRAKQAMTDSNPHSGGAAPTGTLQYDAAANSAACYTEAVAAMRKNLVAEQA